MEMVYQYMWKHRMLGRNLSDVDGRPIEVLWAGRHNTDAGPDFEGARLRIDGRQWAGNVEVHVRASDWHRHGHDADPAYSNVILHVVGQSDCRIPGADGSPIPQVVARCRESFFRMYARLAERIGDYPCTEYLSHVPEPVLADWIATLGVERMQMKARRVADTLSAFSGDWERTCFVTLARALGFGLNAEPFEIMARSLPPNILSHHSDHPLQLQALIFGQAGMLNSSLHIFDEYYQQLCREYYFLTRKYGLRPMRGDMWKYSRTRPQNFPHRRLAILAAACEGGFSLLGHLLDRRRDPASIRELFDWQLSGYWLTHSGFDTEQRPNPAALSEASRSLLIINFATPVLYAYGASRGDCDISECGIDLWEALPPENNAVVRRWLQAGIRQRSAFCSQALLQLSREYCEKGRCLECRIGHCLLRQNAAPGAEPFLSPEFNPSDTTLSSHHIAQ